MSNAPKVTIGMDVGDRYSHVVVLDDSGTVLLRDQIATTERAVRGWFKRYKGARVALEVGRHSPWLSRLLASLELEVIVGNSRQIALIHKTNKKNDRIDAEKLARLARVDPQLLAPVQHRRADTQAALAIVRARDVVVTGRTRLINSVRGQVKAVGGSMPRGDADAFHKRTAELPEPMESGLLPLMDLSGELTRRIQHYDRVIAELCRDVYPETAPLLAVNGGGPVTALAFVLTIEEPGRFPNSRAVGSYLGLRPCLDDSGDAKKELPITRAGDSLLRKLLVQCAQYISDPTVGSAICDGWGNVSRHGVARRRSERRSWRWPAASPSCSIASGSPVRRTIPTTVVSRRTTPPRHERSLSPTPEQLPGARWRLPDLQSG
jgi:transposase